MKEKDYPYSTLRSWLRKKASGEYRDWLNEQFGDLLFQDTEDEDVDVVFSKPIDNLETVKSIEVRFNRYSQSKIYLCLLKIKEIFKNVSLENVKFAVEDIEEKENVFAKIEIVDAPDINVSIKDSSISIKNKIAFVTLSDNFGQIKNSLGKENFVFTIKLTLKNGKSIDIQETITLNDCNKEKEHQYRKKLLTSGVGYIYDLISKHELKKNSGDYYINEKLLKCDFFKAALEYDEKRGIYRNLFYDLFEMNDNYSDEDKIKLKNAMDFVENGRSTTINREWRLKGLLYWQYFSYRCVDRESETVKNLWLAYTNKKITNTFPKDLLEGDDVADCFRKKCLSRKQIEALEAHYKHKKFIDCFLNEVYSFFKSCKEIVNKDLVDKIDVYIDSYENSLERFCEYKEKSQMNFKDFLDGLKKIEYNDYFSSLLKKKNERIPNEYRNLQRRENLINASKACRVFFSKVDCKMILIKKALQILRAIMREYGFYSACKDKWYSSYKNYKNYTQNKFPFINEQEKNHFPTHAEVFKIIKGYYGFLEIKEKKLILVEGLTDLKTENGKPKWPGLVIYCNGIETSKNNESLMNNMQRVEYNNIIAREDEIMQGAPQLLADYIKTDTNQVGGEMTETEKNTFVGHYTKKQAFTNVEENLTSTHRKQ